MIKRFFSAVYILLAALLLCGCAYFESEYYVIEDYAPPVQSQGDEPGKISVSDIESLQQAIRTIISNRDTEGKIVFDTSYSGDPTADMSKACWQVRTQDALCAYCVDNISYELSKIVTYYEARLTISYSDLVNAAGDIKHLTYSAGMESVIKSALESGTDKLIVLVEHSMYTAEDVSGLVLDVYRKNPVCTPAEPVTAVNMFSGSNMQRLYEISFLYDEPEAVLAQKREKLAEFAPFSELDTTELSDSDRAQLAFDYLVENCRVDNENSHSTAYDALINGKADSEGIALALVELCRQLDLECQIVYGQHDWQEHCWNIIGIDDYFCHIDAGLYGRRDVESCFLKSDESFWENYRWDMSSYPACTAKPPAEEIAEDAGEPQEELTEPEPEGDELPAEDESDEKVEPDMTGEEEALSLVGETEEK